MNIDMKITKGLRVTSVHDGDTIRLNTTINVRILGIDSFETRHGKKLLKQARQYRVRPNTMLAMGRLQQRVAEKLLLGTKVDLIQDTNYKTIDRYKRELGYIRMSPRKYYNSYMIRKGYICANPDWPFAKMDYYIHLQEIAYKHHLGIWQFLNLTDLF